MIHYTADSWHIFNVIVSRERVRTVSAAKPSLKEIRFSAPRRVFVKAAILAPILLDFILWRNNPSETKFYDVTPWSDKMHNYLSIAQLWSSRCCIRRERDWRIPIGRTKRQIWANNIRNAGHIRIHPIINRAITTVKVYSDTYGKVIIENYF